jgi:hypothetical protein
MHAYLEANTHSEQSGSAISSSTAFTKLPWVDTIAEATERDPNSTCTESSTSSLRFAQVTDTKTPPFPVAGALQPVALRQVALVVLLKNVKTKGMVMTAVSDTIRSEYVPLEGTWPGGMGNSRSVVGLAIEEVETCVAGWEKSSFTSHVTLSTRLAAKLSTKIVTVPLPEIGALFLRGATELAQRALSMHRPGLHAEQYNTEATDGSKGRKVNMATAV